jgi:NAD(P)-dependent dehydrogenase (short-subunit alcohol dehydrogenase family)
MTQTVVITGASAGIGRATAQLFGKRGDRVGLIARGQAGLDGAVRDVEQAGGKAVAVACDMADYAQVANAAAQIEERLGPIDVWINVAFASVFAPFTEITPEEFRRVTEVSYLGFVHGTMVALSRMRPRGHGTIVQVGSALSHRSIPLQSAYCGAKHAINGFTSSLRTELLHDKSPVNITVVQMPAVNTPQFTWVRSRLPEHPQPVPPIYQPEVAARGVVYAADHPRRKEYWVGGTTAATILANRAAPALLDRYLAKTGYSSQQTGEPTPRDRRDNLMEPVDGGGGRDHGVHGAFDDRSHPRSIQLWAAHHWPVLAGAALAAAAVAGGTAAAIGAPGAMTWAARQSAPSWLPLATPSGRRVRLPGSLRSIPAPRWPGSPNGRAGQAAAGRLGSVLAHQRRNGLAHRLRSVPQRLAGQRGSR